MVVGGVPVRDPLHCQRLADVVIEVSKTFDEFASTFEHKLQIRIGFHTGTVVAGVVGNNKCSFDLWGDVVNIASRLEFTSHVGQIHVSNAVKVRLSDDYHFEDHGETELKGKGLLKTWVLKGKKIED